MIYWKNTKLKPTHDVCLCAQGKLWILWKECTLPEPQQRQIIKQLWGEAALQHWITKRRERKKETRRVAFTSTPLVTNGKMRSGF